MLVRYLGEAGFTHAALSFLIGIVGWLYILGECFFGQMNEIVAAARMKFVQRGYFWLRLIVTIGWAIYPLSNFIASFGGGVDGSGRSPSPTILPTSSIGSPSGSRFSPPRC